MSERIFQRSRESLLVLALTCGCSAVAAPADELTVDPTTPLRIESTANGAAERGNGYTLNSILTRGDNRVAVINSRRVREGETVDQATVTAISENSVTLNIAGRTQVLQLYKSTIKTPAGNSGQQGGIVQ